MQQALRAGILVCLLAGLSGCKGLERFQKPNDSDPSSTDASAPVTSVPIFPDIDSLPKCTDENSGGIAYVAKEKGFFTCEDNEWRFAATRGADGEPGAVISPIGEQWRKVWKKTIASAVYLESKFEASASGGACGGVRYESGSGYIVGKDLVVTNGHVAPKQIVDQYCGAMDLVSITVWFTETPNGDTMHTQKGSADGSVARIDRTYEKKFDTLLLEVPTGDRPAMAISKDGTSEDGIDGDGVKLNDDVLQIGFSGGTTFPHFATGKITQIAKSQNFGGYGFLAQLVVEGLIEKGITVLEYDLISGSGASGGALIDLRGLVVGTNFAGNSKDADTEFGYAIPVESLHDLLKKDRSWEPVSADES